MPFKIELIIADRGWILEKIAKEIEKQCPPNWEMRIATEPTDWGDLHYFIPYSKQPEDKPALSACFFTHQEDVEAAHANFLLQATRADYCVSMSEKYTGVLRDHGVQNVRTIETGVDLEAFDVRLQIGIVGRTYHTGRKGEDLVAQCMDLRNIQFLFTGSGWPGPSVQLSDSELPGFFNKLDYLLIPSRIEGGPVPLMEALASGCQVIAPSNIGFVEKFPHIPFENGDVGSLRRTLEGLVAERQELRDSVTDYSWGAFGARHIEFFDELAATHGFARASDQREPVKLSKLYLMSSGLETTHKGGPTTRMAIVAKHAREQGLEVQNIQEASQLSGADTDCAIVHLFNSWPPHLATAQLLGAREKGYRTVYSTIAMNLEHEDYFTSVMPRVVAKLVGAPSKGKEPQAAPAKPDQLLSAQDYQKDPDLTPIEGIPGHFRSLRESVSCADGVLLLSQYEQSFLERIGCKLEDHAIIDNGVDSAVMAAGDPRLFKEKYKLERYVLVVGRIERRKNLAGVVAALADSDLKLVLIGRALDKEYMDLVNRAAGKNLLHIEHLDNRELLASAYRGAAVFLMASWAEGAPLAALEAASAGTPLVLSSMSSEAEYFGDDALYVHPVDLKDIAEKVHLSANDPDMQSTERRQAMSSKYQPRFSAERHAQQTLDFYSKVHNTQFTDPMELNRPQPRLESSGTALADLVASRTGEKIQLHLGCGGIRWQDFINVDLYPAVEGVQDLSRSGCVADVFEDIRALGLPAETVDEIYSSHVVEHFVRWEACDMLKGWHEILKPGGKLVIEMPSFWRCVAWLFHPSSTKRGLARAQFYGNQWDKLDFETHRYVWGAKEIRKLLKEIGFRKVKVNHKARTHHAGRDMRIVAVK